MLFIFMFFFQLIFVFFLNFVRKRQREICDLICYAHSNIAQKYSIYKTCVRKKMIA